MVGQRARAQVAHTGLDESAQIAGSAMLGLVDREEFIVVPDDHSGPEIIRVHNRSFILLGVGLRTGWRTSGVLSRKSPKP
jgi:hypothetical protein